MTAGVFNIIPLVGPWVGGVPGVVIALTTRDPEGLASALQKLGDYARPMRRQNSTMAHLWMNDPMKPGVMDRMFQTHPPIPDRVKRLMENSARF